MRRLVMIGPLCASLWIAGAPGSLAQGHSAARCVILYEGANCEQDRSSCCTKAAAKMEGCWKNDEARSMKVFGPPGTVIAVFDDPEAGTGDDYFVLIKGGSEPLCVGSFENPGLSITNPPHTYFYSGGNGLDGKISVFRWTDPRHPSHSHAP